MPKVASVVNVPFHAQSSHSGEGMARASLDEDDMWEDDFQTPHTPVHHVVQRKAMATETWLREGRILPGEVQGGKQSTK